MQQYAFGGRNPPGHAGGADSAPQTPSLDVGVPLVPVERERREGGKWKVWRGGGVVEVPAGRDIFVLFWL